jgi:hypothetical protein
MNNQRTKARNYCFFYVPRRFKLIVRYIQYSKYRYMQDANKKPVFPLVFLLINYGTVLLTAVPNIFALNRFKNNKSVKSHTM